MRKTRPNRKLQGKMTSSDVRNALQADRTESDIHRQKMSEDLFLVVSMRDTYVLFYYGFGKKKETRNMVRNLSNFGIQFDTRSRNHAIPNVL